MLLYLSTHNTSTEKKVDGSVHSFYAVNRNFWEYYPKSDVWHFSARRHTVPPKNGVPNFGAQFPKRQSTTQVTVFKWFENCLSTLRNNGTADLLEFPPCEISDFRVEVLQHTIFEL